MDWGHFGEQMLAAAIFGAFGIVLLALALWIATLVSPFSVRKEIEEDQNTALAVLLGSVILGIAIIVASAIR